MAVDRLPPHNIEAEQTTLGSLIIDPDAYVRVAEFLKPDDFYREAHRSIYAAVSDLNERHDPADFITLCDELGRRGVLDEVGGPAYVTTLVNLVPTSAHVEHYGRIVERTATLRRLIAAAGQIADLGFQDADDLEQTLDRSEQILFAVSQRRIAGDFRSLRALLHQYMDQLDTLHQNRGAVAGVPTGFVDLDRLTGGLQPSDLIIIGARPSMGKCVSYRTLIDDPRTGERLTIEECVRRRLAAVLGVSDQGDVRPAAVADWIDSGVKPCFRVTTRTGRSVEVTGHHPFLTVRGWTPLHDLRVGDRIGVPAVLPVFGTNEQWPLAAVRRLAEATIAGVQHGPRAPNSGGPGECQMAMAEVGVCAGRSRPSLLASPPILGERNCNGRSVADFRALMTPVTEGDGRARLAAAGIWRDRQPKGERNRGGPALSLNLPTDQPAALPPPSLSPRIGGEARREGRLPVTAVRTAMSWPPDLRQAPQNWGRGGHAPPQRRAAFSQGFPSVVWTWPRRLLATYLGALLGIERSIEGFSGCVVLPSEALARDVQHALLRFGVLAELEGSTSSAWRVTTLVRPQGGEADVAHRPDSSCPPSGDVFWDEIVAIEPVGVLQVYDLTVPDGANFVAGDVIVHNTALAVSLAHATAMKHGTAVGIFALEMSAEQIVQRFMSIEANVDQQRLRTGYIEDHEWQRIIEAAGALSQSPIYIDDTPGISTMEVRAKSRRLAAQVPLGMLIIDYLQLMQGRGSRDGNRVQEISEISRSLKGLARELHVPVVALAQLSRGVESRQDHRPMLSDLRESGSIEQDADIVMFIYRDEVYNPTTDRQGIADIIVAKHRNGPVGQVSLRWLEQNARFVDLELYRRPSDE